MSSHEFLFHFPLNWRENLHLHINILRNPIAYTFTSQYMFLRNSCLQAAFLKLCINLIIWHVLDKPGKNYSPKLESIFVIWISRQKDNKSFTHILRLEDRIEIRNLRLEDTPLFWATLSPGSLMKDNRRREVLIILFLLALAFSAYPFPCCN